MLKFSNRVYYEVTHRCNLKCIHCCNSEKRDKEILLASDIQKMQEMVGEAGITNSVITGGEPTLRKDFDKIVEILTRYGEVSVTTNGTCYKAQEYIKFLKKYPNLYFQISLDGFTKESHDRIRGKGAFEKTIQVIEGIIMNGFSKRLHISCVITKYNIKEVFSLIKYSEKNKIGSVYFPRLVSAGRGKENWEQIAPSLEEQMEFEVDILKKMSAEDNSLVSLNRLSHFVSSYSNLEQKCIPTLKVAPDGEIYPCPLCNEKRWSLGNIKSINSIQCIEKRYSENVVDQFRQLKKCKMCEMNKLCPQNFCEICKFNPDSKAISEAEMDYQCQLNKMYIKGLTEAEK